MHPSHRAALAAILCAGCQASFVADSGQAPNDDPCSAEALAEPRMATTYYIAVGQPGADNDRCDGLAPSDEGGGRCPFKDLGSERTRALLSGTRDVRVELREGTYVIDGWEGLSVAGAGNSEAERLVLSAYPGENVVLDVPAPDGAGCTEETAPSDPRCVRQVVRVSGQYTVVQGITVQNGLGYTFEVNGGAHHLVQCNLFRETVAFDSRSDLFKIDGGATDVVVRHNELTQWRSQAIDMTGVDGVLIEENDFHHPYDADGGATGAKWGTRNVTVRNNSVHDLGSSTETRIFSLGGTGSPHADDYAAYGIHIVDNRVWNASGMLAQLVSCLDCSIEDNDVWDLAAGIWLTSYATGLPECSASPSGCGPTSNARITGNRFRGMRGAGTPDTTDIFILAEPGETAGLSAGDNLYCAASPEAARFGWMGELVNFSSWVSASGTDSTSAAVSSADARCTDW